MNRPTPRISTVSDVRVCQEVKQKTKEGDYLILTQEDVHYAADAIRGFLDLDRNTGCTILPVITRKRYEVTLNKLESAEKILKGN